MACEGTPDKITNDINEPASDTASDVPTEPGSEPPDFPETPIESVRLVFDEINPELSLGLVSVRFAESELALGDTYLNRSSVTALSEEIALQPPGPEWLNTDGISPEPSLMLAPVLYVDGNSDGQLNSDEPIAGLSLEWLTYLTDPEAGVDLGWYQFVLSFDGGEPVFSNEGEVQVETLFRPLPSPVVTVSGSPFGSPDRLQSVGILFDGEDYGNPLYHSEVLDSMEVSMSGPPPANHVEPYDGDINAATYVLNAYRDANANQTYDENEALVARAGAGTKVLTWVYVQPPLTLDQALMVRERIEFEPITFGWNAGFVEPNDPTAELKPLEGPIELIPL